MKRRSRRRAGFGLVRSTPTRQGLSASTWMLLAGGGAIAAYFLLRDKVVSLLRTTQSIFDAVDEVNPAGNPDLQPHDGATYCNYFIAQVTKKLGVPIPQMLANDQADWVDAGNDGWYPASSPADAQAAALAGKVVVAMWHNLGGHGHASLVLPIAGPMQIAQAGASNFNQGSLASGWGGIQPVFSIHD